MKKALMLAVLFVCLGIGQAWGQEARPLPAYGTVLGFVSPDSNSKPKLDCYDEFRCIVVDPLPGGSVTGSSRLNRLLEEGWGVYQIFQSRRPFELVFYIWLRREICED